MATDLALLSFDDTIDRSKQTTINHKSVLVGKARNKVRSVLCHQQILGRAISDITGTTRTAATIMLSPRMVTQQRTITTTSQNNDRDTASILHRHGTVDGSNKLNTRM